MTVRLCGQRIPQLWIHISVPEPRAFQVPLRLLQRVNVQPIVGLTPGDDNYVQSLLATGLLTGFEAVSNALSTPRLIMCLPLVVSNQCCSY